MLPLGIALAATGLCLQPVTVNAEKGDWLLRVGVGVVDPKSDNLTTPLGALEVDTGTSATIEGTYMLADHWGLELLASYPFSHDVDLDGAGTIAEVEHLPPTLSLQYHFNPEGTFRPYIGAGLNYTTFMNEKAKGTALADNDLFDPELDDSWGAAAQLGADVALNDNWFLNLVVRYIDIESDAELTDDVGSTVQLGTVEIDPFVYQAQVGYRFGKPAPVVAAAVAAPPSPPPPPPPPPPADTDGDGVADNGDQCPDTPRGERVGPQGCSCDVTRQVAFKLNSAELTDGDKAALDEMATNLSRLQFVAGMVVGHTDSSGAEAYNQQLSERRAAAVVKYLESKGISAGRLTASGAGENEPIADNATAEGRALNRRVVLTRTDCGSPR
jgi:outer membrane protein